MRGARRWWFEGCILIRNLWFGFVCQPVALLWGTVQEATAPCAAPGAPQGLRAARPCPPSCCCHGETFTSPTIWWRKALWIGQGSQSDSVLLYGWCPVQNNILDIQLKQGKLDFFFPPTGHLICFNLHAIYICKVKCLWSVCFLTPTHLQADIGCCILTWEAIEFWYKM